MFKSIMFHVFTGNSYLRAAVNDKVIDVLETHLDFLIWKKFTKNLLTIHGYRCNLLLGYICNADLGGIVT